MLAMAGPVPLTYRVPPMVVVDQGMVQTDTETKAAGPPSPRASQKAAEAAADPRGVPAVEDPYFLVGPTPAFEANVLDSDRNFDAVLARLELARSRNEMRRMGPERAPTDDPTEASRSDDTEGEAARVEAGQPAVNRQEPDPAD